ncbi:MAG: MotA/TolQ/ExbB proton channel family protein [Gammaproteobacteria bacterium]|nr:MotA/TolQ/ExbB proton channel family protein [Gammaproteobacteria bacterium]
MKRGMSSELLFQVGALVIAALLVHLVYQVFIWGAPLTDVGQLRDTPRSIYFILRGLEQEACFILMVWSLAIMGYKARAALLERSLLDQDLIGIVEGVSILPTDSRKFLRPLEALPGRQNQALLTRALMAALSRFASTRNITDVSESVRSICESEAERLDSELAMVRYIAWAIPSIGFIGTVRGIGQALGRVDEVVQKGDISGVTASLGIAFNSTFIALLISILVMFFVYQLQLVQERLVLDAQRYCDEQLIRHMTVRE